MKEKERRKKIGNSIDKKGLSNSTAKSLLDVSSRTTSKIITRMLDDKKICCSICGWDKARGDIHHINGRKILDADNHKNLCYLCPNCHRLAHKGKLKKEELISLEVQIGNSWIDYFYGSFKTKTQIFEEKRKIKIKGEKIKLDRKKRKEKIINSNIDFSKYGWVTKVATEIEIHPQKVGVWMKRNMPELYSNAFKRK